MARTGAKRVPAPRARDPRGRGERLLAPAREVRLVLSTAPPRSATRLAKRWVEEGGAACVSALPGARSVYRWKGRVEAAQETLLLAKTTRRGLARLVRVMRDSHPYEVPEILVWGPEAGLSSYVAWLVASTSDGAA